MKNDFANIAYSPIAYMVEKKINKKNESIMQRITFHAKKNLKQQQKQTVGCNFITLCLRHMTESATFP